MADWASEMAGVTMINKCRGRKINYKTNNKPKNVFENTGVALNAYDKGKTSTKGNAKLKSEVPSTKEIRELTFFVIKEPYNAILGPDACIYRPSHH